MIALQTRPADEVLDLGYADFTLGSLHKALTAADEFRRHLDTSAIWSRECGISFALANDKRIKKTFKCTTALDLLLARLSAKSIVKKHPTDYSTYKAYLERVSEAAEPILLRVCVGPVKNVHCCGDEQRPDLAEYLAIVQLGRVVEIVASLYPHGVKVQLVPDDIRARTANLCPLCYVDCYITGLQRLVHSLGWSDWMTVEPGQTRLYRQYRVPKYIAEAESNLDADAKANPLAFAERWAAALYNAQKNLATGESEEDFEASARRYLVQRDAELLSGLWSPVDAFPLFYARYENAFQLFTLTRGRAKLPWQIALPVGLADEVTRQALPQYLLS